MCNAGFDNAGFDKYEKKMYYIHIIAIFFDNLC